MTNLQTKIDDIKEKLNVLASGADLGVIKYIDKAEKLIESGCYLDAAFTLSDAATNYTSWDDECLDLVDEIKNLCDFS